MCVLIERRERYKEKSNYSSLRGHKGMSRNRDMCLEPERRQRYEDMCPNIALQDKKSTKICFLIVPFIRNVC